MEWRRHGASEWITEGGREFTVARDGAFPLQEEGMFVLAQAESLIQKYPLTRLTLSVNLGGNTDIFVPNEYILFLSIIIFIRRA